MRVLIISYAPLSLKSNGGKSFLSLFSNFKKDQLVQFYINPSLPEKCWCESYYQQKERDLINIFKNKRKKHSITPKDDDFNSNTSKKTKNRYFKLFIRDIVWKLFFKINGEFEIWVKRYAPDIIFSDTGDSSFLYNLTIKISKRFNIPFVGYFGDDYYSLKAKKLQVFKRIVLNNHKKVLKKFISLGEKHIFVNEYFETFYKNEFSIDDDKLITIYNGSNFDFQNNCSHVEDRNSLILSYIGNISLKRDENIISLGEALDFINNNLHTNHKLLVYTRINDDFILRCKKVNSIKFMGAIPGKEVKSAIENSDILIHTESFNKNEIEMTKYSFSTKIADSLSSGKCLLAYGPPNIASMDYLINNNCAFCIVDKQNLLKGLKELLTNCELRKMYGEIGKKVAYDNHNSQKNSDNIKTILERIINKRS